MAEAAGLDPDRVNQVAYLVFSQLQGAMTSAMIHLGGRLGLYRALADGRAVTSAELAASCALHERWVREWLYNQAAAHLVDTGDGGATFSLAPEAAAVLADEQSPAYGMGMFHQLPETMAVLGPVAESFRTGIGLDYDTFGPQGAIGVEQGFGPWNTANLVPVVLPALEGVVESLERGATVVDVGCGAGAMVLLMAERFPASRVAGYDISRHALERAEQQRLARGLDNASFHDARTSSLPRDHSVDVITTFDCIHDMTHPMETIRAIREAIADDGTWLLVDIKALETFAENATKNPMAALMYGTSVLTCMSSATSEPGGAGLGTLGLPPSLAERMATDAGFSRFRVLDIEHPTNHFYEIRP